MESVFVTRPTIKPYDSRTGIAAGSPVPIELMKSLIARLNLRDLTNAYGMSTFSI